MINLTNLPILNNNHEQLIDNLDYIDLHSNPSQYLIVYSYIHNLIDISTELIINNIEFSHYPCPISDESYILININQ
jgi:hypothetical protein